MESSYSWNLQRWTEINTTEPCFFRNSPRIDSDEVLSPESKLSQINKKGKRDERKVIISDTNGSQTIKNSVRGDIDKNKQTTIKLER